MFLERVYSPAEVGSYMDCCYRVPFVDTARARYVISPRLAGEMISRTGISWLHNVYLLFWPSFDIADAL